MHLQDRFIEDMRLGGYSTKTREAYAPAVSKLVIWVGAPPRRISEEAVRRYFLHLTYERNVARGTASIALCAAKLFFERTLGREWTTLELARPPREHKLPVVLSQTEVAAILAEVHIPVYRVCMATIAACARRRTFTPCGTRGPPTCSRKAPRCG